MKRHYSLAGRIARVFLVFWLLSSSMMAWPQSQADYTLGPGDVIRIQVFQNPDLTVETRVAESGQITYPLIGTLPVGGLAIAAAEKKIAEALQNGGFVQAPQVNIVVLQVRGNQVAVLGQVNRPGRFPLETLDMRLTDLLALAGGISANGDDMVIFNGVRAGLSVRKQIDVPALLAGDKNQENPVLAGGDIIYVQRAPVFYIYGEAQRPGGYRIERGMTLMQALAIGGGPTPRGSEQRLKVYRQNGQQKPQVVDLELTDLVRPNDVLFVPERIF